ncbi:MAG: bile acid:sodium symporter [Planctomycetaceae bacterium]|nr:bile acid:sodium symporter [Planctomycetaceae bacterium]
MKATVTVLKQQWFLLALSLVVVVGMWQATFFAPYTEGRQFRSAVVGLVMFLTALPLPLGAFLRAVRRPQAALLASVINLGFAPLLAWPFVKLLGPQLGGGLAVALAVPCTLSTAAVWTRRAGGNDVTAVMVTILTNLTCVVATPLWLWLMTSQIIEDFSLWEQIQRLGWLVLLPIGLAQGARCWPRLAHFASQRKPLFGILSQVGVLYIVLLGSVQSALVWRQGQSDSLWQWLMVLALIPTIHLGLFCLGLALARWTRLGVSDHSAVAISGSQKTFMIGAEVALTLGLSILPLLIYHVFQLFADTVLADRMRQASAPGSASLGQGSGVVAGTSEQ